MIRTMITRTPPTWEKDQYQNEPEHYTPPHLFLLNRACFVGLTFFTESETEANPSAFVYASRYINKRSERVCRLERLSFLSTDREAQLKIIEEIPSIATQILGPLDILETEVFSKVDSPIFFPSTLYLIGSCNKRETLSLYQEAGFKTTQIKHCYEIDLNSVNEKELGNQNANVNIRPIRRDEWPTYWTLWGESDYCLDTSYPFKSLTNAMFSDFAPFPPDQPHTVTKLQLGFISKLISRDASPLGFIQWAPNIYRLPSMNENPSTSVDAKELAEINEAKIYKFFTKPRLDISLLRNTLDAALSTLKTGGIKKCQIGNFKADDPLTTLLKARPMNKHVHTAETLQKKIA